jgi:SAM-dependent methyltransferase
LPEGYAERIGRLLYAHTDEKERFSDWLSKHLAGRQFDAALDVGPGPGLITAPLAAVTRHLVLVEKDPSYTRTLQEKFPVARVEALPIQEWDRRGQCFDFILYSHGLYYQPEGQWFPVCRRLHSSLRPGGELVVVLNSDEGDWWRILEACEHLRAHWTFHYRRASLFVEELGGLGPTSVVPFNCELTFSDCEQMAEFIGHQAIQIFDEAVLSANRAIFQQLAQHFVRQNGGPILRIRSDIYLIEA